jgi:hypothetical protein
MVLVRMDENRLVVIPVFASRRGDLCAPGNVETGKTKA